MLYASKELTIGGACVQQELFHREFSSPREVKAERCVEVLSSIEATGTYDLTYDELQHGAHLHAMYESFEAGSSGMLRV